MTSSIEGRNPCSESRAHIRIGQGKEEAKKKKESFFVRLRGGGGGDVRECLEKSTKDQKTAEFAYLFLTMS